MPKQYTFKTTRTTEWMEEHLDSLPPSERSRFIRACIEQVLKSSKGVTKSSEKVLESVIKTEKVLPTPPTPIDLEDPEPLFGEGVEVEINLDDALNSLDY